MLMLMITWLFFIVFGYVLLYCLYRAGIEIFKRRYKESGPPILIGSVIWFAIFQPLL